MVENTPSEPTKRKTGVLFKTVGYTTLLAGIIFSIWGGHRLLEYPSLQGILQESTLLRLSNFQMGIAFAGLAGLLTTVFVQRKRRTKRTKVRPLKMTRMVFGTEKNVHPLMMTARPSRDPNFVIRKTRTRGRISRNRMGERLPPPPISQPGPEES